MQVSLSNELTEHFFLKRIHFLQFKPKEFC